MLLKSKERSDNMLFDVENRNKREREIVNSKEYKDLVYELESFLIDTYYDDGKGHGECEPIKQEYKGKVEIANKVIDELEHKRVFGEIRPVLCELGIPESVKGFRLLEECVLEAARKNVCGECYFMMDIYPIVAQRFNITSHNAERLCRYACDYVTPTRLAVRKFPFLEPLTHRTVENVTVKELVDLLVCHVVLKCKFKRRKTNI